MSAQECLWCKYLKFETTLTNGAIVYAKNGTETTPPKTTTRLPICDICKDEHNTSVGNMIRKIVAFKPDLKEWLSSNPQSLKRGEFHH